MVTSVVAIAAEQPPVVGPVQVTVYVPEVLLLGVIAPVFPSIVNPAGAAEYVPVEYAPIPLLNVTACGEVSDLQNGSA